MQNRATRLKSSNSVVYRELAKTDKTKRGSSNINGSSSSVSAAAGSKPRTGAPPTPGTITISAPMPSTKPKEKERERAFGHSPFTSTPLVQSYGPGDVGESVSVSRMGMDVDWEEELGEREGDVEGGEGVGDDEEGDDDVADEVEDDDVDDRMEVEAEEMRRDERGLDGHE